MGFWQEWKQNKIIVLQCIIKFLKHTKHLQTFERCVIIFDGHTTQERETERENEKEKTVCVY